MKIENQLIGATVEEAIKMIKTKESNADFYQIYIATREHKEKNYFNLDKRVHIRNQKGERCYRIVNYDLLTYAKDQSKENNTQKDSFILDVKILKEYHDNWSFNGFESTQSHNVYYLYIDGLKKDNKGRETIINRKEELKPYKNGELTPKQRRFTL